MLRSLTSTVVAVTLALSATSALAFDRSLPARLPMVLPQSKAAPVQPQLNAPRPAGAMMSPKAAAPAASVDDVINALTAVKASKGGKVMEVPLPEGLRLMLKNPMQQGKITPKPTGGGGDDKKFKQIKNTEDFPYATMGLIGSGCTGTLVAGRFVVTAAMCLYDQKNKKFFEDLDFYPGINGDKQPFGKLAWKDAYVPKGYAEKGDTQYDFGLIVLDPKAGDQIGWMGMGHIEKFNLKEVTLTGYPWEGVDQNTEWQTNCAIDAAEKDYLFYRCPGPSKALGAMTGAPLWFKGKADDEWQIVGIHNYAQDDKMNSWWALRLNQNTMDTMLAWIDDTNKNGGNNDSGNNDGGNNDAGNNDGGNNDQSDCTCEDN